MPYTINLYYKFSCMLFPVNLFNEIMYYVIILYLKSLAYNILKHNL